MSDLVIISDDGSVRTVRMNRPDKKNALTLPMYDAMAGAIESAPQNPALRCLLIAGAPTAFCAGNDIGDFLQMAMGTGALGAPILRFLHALARCEMPLVAAVQGNAVGVGTTMLMHCDHVVAADNARVAVDLAGGDEAGRQTLVHRAKIAHRVPDVGGGGIEGNVVVDGGHGFNPCVSQDGQSFVGWAKARWRRAHHLFLNGILSGGHASLCPPYGTGGRTSRANRLDIVAVGVDQECGIVGRAVVLARTGRTVVAAAGFQAICVKFADRGMIFGAEGDMGAGRNRSFMKVQP